jgi:1,4-alpha-glucan branching enzyme
LLCDPLIEQLLIHEPEKQLVYRRGPLVFVFNFHPTHSHSDWRIPVPDATDYQTVLNTDDKAFAGHGLVAEGQKYPWQSVPLYGRRQTIQIYVPSRSAQVLAPVGLVRT